VHDQAQLKMAVIFCWDTV